MSSTAAFVKPDAIVRHHPVRYGYEFRLPIVALSGLLAVCTAHAQAADSPAASEPAAPAATPASPLSANITVASQYVGRGIRQTWGGPALQGGVDYAAPNGFFLGVWGSNVSSKFIEGGSVEVDLYGGYAASAGDVNYSIGLFYYTYPGARMSATGTRYDYGELALSGNYKWFTLKYNLTVTRDYFGFNSATLGEGNNRHSRGSGYLDLSLDIPLGDEIGLHLHYGNQRVNHFSHYNWQDVEVSLSKGFSGGWKIKGGVTAAHNDHGVYTHYTTGIPNANGEIASSNPLQTTVFVTLTKTF